MKTSLTRAIIAIAVAIAAFGSKAYADEIQEVAVKVGETAKLEIPAYWRNVLRRATNKRPQWDVNSTYLEVVSNSWDHCYVRGKAVTTATTPVQLTVTMNLNGHYNDHYYCAFRVRVQPNGPTSISLYQTSLEMETGQVATLDAYITGGAGTYDWVSSSQDIVSVRGYGLTGNVTAVAPGVAYVTVSTGTYSASCRIVVSDPGGSSYVEDLGAEEACVAATVADGTISFSSPVYVEAYSASGRLEYAGTTGCIEGLARGVHILRYCGTAAKVLL